MIFVQLFGGNAVGKSSVLGTMQEKFGAREDVAILGKYKLGKIVQYYTGGLDAEKMTNAERFAAIRQAWLDSSKKVVACEGMMTTQYSTFFLKYYELQKELPRKVYAIFLHADQQERIRRITERGKGKAMNPTRLANIIGKDKGSRSIFNKLRETDNYKKLSFDTTKTEGMESARVEVEKIFEEALK